MIMPTLNIRGSRCSSQYRSLSLSLLLITLMMISVGVQAQPGGLDDDPGSSVPVDGGISVLLGAGIYLGARRMKNRYMDKANQVKGLPRS
jgi:hypothetical protein